MVRKKSSKTLIENYKARKIDFDAIKDKVGEWCSNYRIADQYRMKPESYPLVESLLIHEKDGFKRIEKEDKFAVKYILKNPDIYELFGMTKEECRGAGLESDGEDAVLDLLSGDTLKLAVKYQNTAVNSKLAQNQAEQGLEYERLTENAEQGILDLETMMREPDTYGYISISSTTQAGDDDSFENQKIQLEQAGAKIFFEDVYTDITTDRLHLSELVDILQPGDTLVVTRIDRIARTIRECAEIIENLAKKDITVRVLDVGVLDDSTTGKMMLKMLHACAAFE